MPAVDRPRRAWIAGGAFVVLMLTFWLSPLRDALDPDQVARWLRRIGDAWWAPLLFIGLYAIFNVLLVPATILTLTAGIVWGWALGGLWVLAASTLGSLVPYLLARAASGEFAARIRTRSARLAAALEREGFLTLLLLRLIPVVPYNLLNYAAGLAGIALRDYVLATLFGTIPAIFIFTFLAETIAAGVLSPREAFARITLAGAGLAVLALATRLFGSRVKSRLDGRGAADDRMSGPESRAPRRPPRVPGAPNGGNHGESTRPAGKGGPERLVRPDGTLPADDRLPEEDDR